MTSVTHRATTSQHKPSIMLPPSPDIVPADSPRSGSRFWPWLRTALSTALVISALAGIGAWGYGTDWTLPKFSALVGSERQRSPTGARNTTCPSRSASSAIKDLATGGAGLWLVPGARRRPVPVRASRRGTAQDRPQRSRPRIWRGPAARSRLLPRAENNSRCKLHQRRIQFASVRGHREGRRRHRHRRRSGRSSKP